MNAVDLIRESLKINGEDECYIHIECRHDLNGSHQFVKGGSITVVLNLAKLIAKIIVDDGFPIEIFLKMLMDEITEKKGAKFNAEECDGREI